MLATLGPLSDEIAVYPVRNAQLAGSEDAWRYAFAFAIPCDTPGLRFLCRESFDLGRSTFDHPLGSRFEEMDAIVFMDDVLVPWERVFLFGDVDLANGVSPRTNQYNHSGHQVVTKNVAKCEFVLGVACLVVRTLGSEDDSADSGADGGVDREPGDNEGPAAGGGDPGGSGRNGASCVRRSSPSPWPGACSSECTRE